jgi:predicted phage-related endonuclease
MLHIHDDHQTTVPMTYSPEWYALRVFNPDRPRPVVIGASEAAAACNQSPYSSALQLYLEKRGELLSEFSPDQQNRLNMGRKLEPIILDCYEERTKCHLTRGLPVYFHPTWEFMAATPDAIGYIDEPDTETWEEWSVDAKSTGWRMIDKTGSDSEKYGEEGTDQIPVSNLFQAQQQMAVMGLARCDFPVLVDGRELRIYTVQRNDDLIQQIALAEAELAERIRDGRPPEPNWEHSGTIKVLQKLFGTEVGKVAWLSDEHHQKWIERDYWSQQEKSAKELKDKITAEILWALQDAEVGRFPEAGIEIKKTVVKEAHIPSYVRAGYTMLKARKLK